MNDRLMNVWETLSGWSSVDGVSSVRAYVTAIHVAIYRCKYCLCEEVITSRFFVF